MPTITLTVAAENDDTWNEVHGGVEQCYRTYSTGKIGYRDADNFENAGFRFLTVPLDSRHRIKRARLSLHATANDSQSFELRIGCEDADNAGNFVAECNPGTHPMTSAYTTQTSATTVAEERFYSDDFAAAVQEVLARPGWTAGNALVVLCVQQSAAGGSVQFYQYNSGTSAKAPKLEIEYEDYDGGAMF